MSSACFDALNDLRNMETAIKATKKYGGTAARWP